jgi:hypothetical protein
LASNLNLAKSFAATRTICGTLQKQRVNPEKGREKGKEKKSL